MKSGDVKRGADMQISLVGATEQFDAAWKKTVEEFTRDYGNARAKLKEAFEAQKQASKQAQEAESQAFNQLLEDSPLTRHSSDKFIATSRQAREVRARYLALAQKMVADAQPRIARSDVNGHYQFQGVPAGRYYVFAERRVFDNDLRWKVVAEVKAGANRIDLSNSNAGWPF
jgi:hypothetical protein